MPKGRIDDIDSSSAPLIRCVEARYLLFDLALQHGLNPIVKFQETKLFIHLDQASLVSYLNTNCFPERDPQYN